MRSPSPDSRRSLTVTLIIILLVLFVVQACLMFYADLPLDDWFGLSLNGIKHGKVWQLLTFQFLHAVPWPWHVLFNCIALYFFGRSVEETLGRKRFLILYFMSGFAGGALQLLTTWILPRHLDIPVVGASAGIMGLLAAYAALFPMRELTYFVYFFPITIRAIWLFWVALAFSIFGTLVPYDNVANAAHLGGLLMGVAFIRWGEAAHTRLTSWRPFQSRKRKLELVKAASIKPGRFRRLRPQAETPVELPSEDFIAEQIDPILDKISAHGIQSLTERERQILQAARNKMTKK
jgi:membrane associated rhomboid family serine protease